MKSAYTGGELNILNGQAGVSAPGNSVPVMKLIRTHNPKSASELEMLIEEHYVNDCECGIKSKGSVLDFGKNLYNAQKIYWGEYKYSLDECIMWEYNLFISQSLKGCIAETECKKLIEENLKQNFSVRDSNAYIDEELRVDLEILKDNEVICGIQIKPKTFKNVRENVINFNKKMNTKYPYPVHYVFYDDEGMFINLESICEELV